jgi:hydrogenase 3 maturation protease
MLAVRRLAAAFASRPADGDTGSKHPARNPAPFFFEAGPIPEASAGPLRRFRPDWVVFLDSADLGEKPGSIGWIEPEMIGGAPAGTHTFPLEGFSRYLQSELGCRVALLGIQPRQLEFDSPASPEILSAVEEIVQVLLTAAESRTQINRRK